MDYIAAFRILRPPASGGVAPSAPRFAPWIGLPPFRTRPTCNKGWMKCLRPEGLRHNC
jgi:hypothetical protein